MAKGDRDTFAAKPLPSGAGSLYPDHRGLHDDGCAEGYGRKRSAVLDREVLFLVGGGLTCLEVAKPRDRHESFGFG
jgi:hypothetical protein